MDLTSGVALIDPAALPDLTNYDPLSSDAVEPIQLSRKRKHSVYSQNDQSDEDTKPDSRLLDDGYSSRRPRPPGTKRACNQCRQQKLKCNVVEDPWTDCDRCTKHNLRCEITADFKRVGKRSQQAELERNNHHLADRVAQLEQELAVYKQRDSEFDSYKSSNSRDASDRTLALTPSMSGAMTQDDGSHDAALLLNLKQSHDISGPGARASPASTHRRLGSVSISSEQTQSIWDEYYQHYHEFLSVLDPEVDTPDTVLSKSRILFWTVTLIASRHFSADDTLFSRLLPPYQSLVKEIMAKPPSTHYVVKALCLLCYWPPPVSSTTADMSFAISGVLMKFAMQLGLHRPSHPMDFSRTRVQLKQEDISDRLRTWAVCNLVAQNISTGYGQPPDTVYDSTLNGLQHQEKFSQLYARLEIEKLADKITRTIYSPQHHGLAGIEETPIQVKAAIVAQGLQNMSAIADIDTPIHHVYASAVNLHLRLFVFFDEPSSQRYQLNLNDLYNAATSFLRAVLNCGTPLCYVPNYISQMMQAATVALLKLLQSFFADHVDRDAGEELFWNAITGIRETSVTSNDLPQRMAEVFAQMWKADDERQHEHEQLNTIDPTSAGMSTTTNTSPDVPGSSLTLKRRYRMSMSHVFDSIWRWKDELEGKVRAEKLDAAVRNPTSPHATSHHHFHRNSLSAASVTGLPITTSPNFSHANAAAAAEYNSSSHRYHERRRSEILADAPSSDVALLSSTTAGSSTTAAGFGAFGNLSLDTASATAANSNNTGDAAGGGAGAGVGGGDDLAYANSYEFFDPVGWYLDGLFEPSGLDFS